MQRTNQFVVSHLAARDPEVVTAGLVFEREGIPVRVLGPGQLPSQDPLVMVLADRLFQNPRTYAAIETFQRLNPNLVIRWASETPSISIQHARARGFDESEIEAALMPWIAAQRAGALRLADEAQKLASEAEKQYQA